MQTSIPPPAAVPTLAAAHARQNAEVAAEAQEDGEAIGVNDEGFKVYPPFFYCGQDQELDNKDLPGTVVLQVVRCGFYPASPGAGGMSRCESCKRFEKEFNLRSSKRRREALAPQQATGGIGTISPTEPGAGGAAEAVEAQRPATPPRQIRVFFNNEKSQIGPESYAQNNLNWEHPKQRGEACGTDEVQRWIYLGPGADGHRGRIDFSAGNGALSAALEAELAFLDLGQRSWQSKPEKAFIESWPHSQAVGRIEERGVGYAGGPPGFYLGYPCAWPAEDGEYKLCVACEDRSRVVVEINVTTGSVLDS